jgi:hypothetical protein
VGITLDRAVWPIGLVAGCAGALGWFIAEPVDLRKDRSFEISKDPAVKVLEVHHLGGMIRSVWSYEIFGDGRLVCSRDRRPAQKAIPREILFEERLPRSELLAIFDDLTSSGVLEADWKAMSARLRTRGRVTDAGSTFVVLRLTRYRQRTAGPSGSIKFQIGQYAIGHAIQNFPEIKELAALGRLLDRLEVIRKSWPPR